MSAPARGILWALLLALFTVSVVLQKTGIYGWTLFVVFPSILGAAVVDVVRPRDGWTAAGVGALSAVIAAFGFLFIGMEGFGCVLMCAPLLAPVGAFGGWVAYQLRTVNIRSQGTAMMLVLVPASLTFDLKFPPTVFAVHSQVTVAATPEQVWKHVVTFSDLPEPDEWFFRAGLAYPKRARIVGSGAGAIRYCEFSTGSFVEPIEVWDEPRLLAFRVTENPAPMNEWSPYAHVLPKHLHGYFISKHGEFRLTGLPDGRTLLEGTTWYQHGLWPGEYWRWWSDAIIHRIHLRVLNHVKMLAEKEANAFLAAHGAAPQRQIGHLRLQQPLRACATAWLGRTALCPVSPRSRCFLRLLACR
jgi:hypothetical protein